MKKRKFPFLLVLGSALVFISLSLMLTLQIRLHIGDNKCQNVIKKIEELLPEKSVAIPENDINPNMPVMEIDGKDFAAILEIPSFDVILPVADKWDSEKLFDSPARFYGSAYNNTLVIGGSNYSHQFSFCGKIDNNATVTVTDMTGAQFTYRVATVERSKKADSSWLANQNYDLTLFCRNTYSMEYIAVRCNFAYN